jgi:hypothetical protein
MGGPCSIPICLNDDRYAEFYPPYNCINLRTDLVHVVEIIEFAYGTSWNLRRSSWIRKRDEVELYLPKTSEMIHIQ